MFAVTEERKMSKCLMCKVIIVQAISMGVARRYALVTPAMVQRESACNEYFYVKCVVVF